MNYQINEVDHNKLDYVLGGGPSLELQNVRKLVRAGVDINARNQWGCTVLMTTVIADPYGDHDGPEYMIRAIEVLLKNGADVDLRNRDGMTAYDFCFQLQGPNYRDSVGGCPRDYWRPGTFEVIDELLVLLTPGVRSA